MRWDGASNAVPVPPAQQEIHLGRGIQPANNAIRPFSAAMIQVNPDSEDLSENAEGVRSGPGLADSQSCSFRGIPFPQISGSHIAQLFVESLEIHVPEQTCGKSSKAAISVSLHIHNARRETAFRRAESQLPVPEFRILHVLVPRRACVARRPFRTSRLLATSERGGTRGNQTKKKPQ